MFGFRDVDIRGIGNTSLWAQAPNVLADGIGFCPQDITARSVSSETFQRLERREPNERSVSWRR